MLQIEGVILFTKEDELVCQLLVNCGKNFLHVHYKGTSLYLASAAQ